MKKVLCQILFVTIFSDAFAATGTNLVDLKTNQAIIDGEVVDGVMSNGILTVHKWEVISNTLYDFHFDFDESIKAPPGVVIKDDPNRVLQLYAAFGLNGNSVKFGNVITMYGLIHTPNDWKIPSRAQTNLIDVLCSEDKTKIAVMVCDNGPIFYSTNSGVSWDAITKPRREKYCFPLAVDSEGHGFYAEATIHPQPTKKESANSTASNWYVVGTASNGSDLVVSGNASRLAPILSILHSGNTVILSWSLEATNFIAQQNSDLTATNWVDVTNAVNVVSNQNQVIIPTTSTNYFYRLKSQVP